MGAEASQSVSPVFVYWSFAIAPMSPASILSATVRFLPVMMYTVPGFSAFSSRELNGTVAFVSVPENTFIIEILPTKGSATVFMT